MQFRRKVAAYAMAAASATVGLTATAPVASAASANTPAAGGTAPACVSRDVWGAVGGFDVAIQNNCTKTMRVQVIVSFGADSPCYTLARGQFEAFAYRGITGRYERVAVC
ncbi:hypothetical protein ACWCO0_25645 [Streptomyces tubercidicus]|uniref:hypothetical protein n=1 Tax=Streptomyces tubercidicus TaxID=47759 RepID=UPI0022B77211|nr:hypothetical protein [Streptomyces tubercidicus]WAU10040.1 hypothetical protein STRTU_000088 [Streptomyces tubercidicus]